MEKNTYTLFKMSWELCDSLEVLKTHDVEVVEPFRIPEGFVEPAEEDKLVSPNDHAVAAPRRGGLAGHV